MLVRYSDAAGQAGTAYAVNLPGMRASTSGEALKPDASLRESIFPRTRAYRFENLEGVRFLITFQQIIAAEGTLDRHLSSYQVPDAEALRRHSHILKYYILNKFQEPSCEHWAVSCVPQQPNQRNRRSQAGRRSPLHQRSVRSTPSGFLHQAHDQDEGPDPRFPAPSGYHSSPRARPRRGTRSTFSNAERRPCRHQCATLGVAGYSVWLGSHEGEALATPPSHTAPAALA